MSCCLMLCATQDICFSYVHVLSQVCVSTSCTIDMYVYMSMGEGEEDGSGEVGGGGERGEEEGGGRRM